MTSPPGAGISIQQPAAAAAQKASPSDQNQPEQAATRRRERLGVARTTFETIEAISGTIPVVGSYVGAGAKVGLVVVQMIQVRGFPVSNVVHLAYADFNQGHGWK